MTLHYLQALIPLAIGIYLGLAWDSLPFRIPNLSFVLQPEYEVLTPSLVAEIEELRKRWDIRGMSIAVVKQDGGHEYNVWKTDTFGLGVADGTGTPVSEEVSTLSTATFRVLERSIVTKCGPCDLQDIVLYRIKYKAVRCPFDRNCHRERNLAPR